MSILDNIKKGQSHRAPRIMMIGVEGVGKSTAGANMPNPVFICGEEGLVGPQFADTPSYTPVNWEDLLKFVDALATEKNEFKSVVIDTLDWLEPMLYAHVCTKAGHKNIEDFGYGKGYVVAQQEARNLLMRLDRLNVQGMNVLILCHSQIKTVNNPVGDNYDHFEAKVNAKICGIFREWCDAVLFAQFDMFTKKDGMRAKAYGGDGRIVQTTHSAAWDAKNRYGLPEVMPLDMAAILDAINAGQVDVESLKKEFREYVKTMDKDVAKKAVAWLEGGKWSTQQLAQKVNSLRVKNSINNNSNEKESANG
jgi:hypothetical protein